MNHLQQSAEIVASFMRLITSTGGLRLKYRITAGPGAADPEGFERRDIYVECRGPDTWLLLEHDGDLLRSLEHIAAKMLRLEPEDHDRVSFDADGYKALRAHAIRQTAATAVTHVQSTGQPFRFQPMNSRERRMLHLSLQESGLSSASSGEGAQRFVVLYPPGFAIPAPGRPSASDHRHRPMRRNVDYGNT
jgi:spoIIIJ-associated protein